MEAEDAGHGIIHHRRWDHLLDILPHLLFRPRFRSFVLASFTADRIAAQAILYRLA